ncbi:MAG: MFS transporter [Actinomycetota bacterium]|nr:MFS transporter [Actinomycetota bacterium]
MTKLSPIATLSGGVLAAGQLGAVGPVSDLLDHDLRLSAGFRGAAISIITLLAAAAAAPVGLWSRRHRPAGLVVGGLLLMAAAGLSTELFARSALAFLLLRALAGAGYLLVVVVGPALLVQQVATSHRPMFFALWGSCTPAGLALAAGFGGLLGQSLGWRGWFLVLSAVTALAAVAILATQRPAGPPAIDQPAAATVRAALFGRPLLIAASFCLVALISVAVASLLPSYLSDAEQLSTSRAGLLTSIVAIASVPGSVLAGLLLRRGIAPQAIGPAVLLCPAFGFLAFTLPVPVTVRVAAAALLTFAGGLGVAASYGSLPRLVAEPDLALANGLLVQLGSLGTLVAPPIFSAATGLHRWSLVAPMLAVPAVLSVLLLIAATRRPSETITDPPISRSTACS